MRAVITACATVPGSEVEVRVAARTARQRILDGRRAFTFSVHEQALRLPVGGPTVVSDQLHQLLRTYLPVRASAWSAFLSTVESGVVDAHEAVSDPS